MKNHAQDMQIKELYKKTLFNISIILFIFLLDRFSKYFVLEFFNKTNEKDIIITSFLSLNLLWNEGIAFGLFQSKETIFYNFITILIVLVLCFVAWLASKSNRLEKICYLIIIGGGLGNTFDRLYYGSVMDFIDLNYKNFHWFIFNVADIFITIGVLILIFLEFTKKND